MIKLNNKGQSLVLFILILPILLLVSILVFEIGNVYTSKSELDDINYLVIDYGLDHITETNLEGKLIELIKLNSNDLFYISVNVEDSKINVTTKRKVKGILSKSFDIFEVVSNYEGYMENEDKVIGRVWFYD